jgi:hypothetical protein
MKITKKANGRRTVIVNLARQHASARLQQSRQPMSETGGFALAPQTTVCTIDRLGLSNRSASERHTASPKLPKKRGHPVQQGHYTPALRGLQRPHQLRQLGDIRRDPPRLVCMYAGRGLN